MDKLELAANQELQAKLSGYQQEVEMLRSQLELSTAIVNAMDAIALVLDSKGHIISCNTSFEQIIGYTLAEVTHQPFWELFCHQQEKEPVKAVFDRVGQEKKAIAHQHDCKTKDNSSFPIAWKYTPLLNSDGALKYAIAIGNNITAKTPAERTIQEQVAQLEARNQLLEERDRLLEVTASAANALLTLENFDEAVNTALQILGESLDCDRIAVIENFDSGSDPLSAWWRVLYEWNSPHAIPQISHPDVAQGSYKEIEEWYKLFSQGQGISALLEEMPELLRIKLAKVGVKATHIVPIFVEDKFWGVVGFDDCHEAKRRSLAELAVLKIAADCLGSAIQRDRTQQALLKAEQERSKALERHNSELQQILARLSQSEQRYRQIMDIIGEGIVRVEYEVPIPVNLPVGEQLQQLYQHFRVVEHNLAYAEMFGYEQPDAMVGKRLSELHAVNDSTTIASMRQFIEEGWCNRNMETVEVDRFGRKHHFLNNTVTQFKDGCAISAWVTQVDITQLRETQQALLEVEQARSQELEKVNNALKKSLDSLASEPSLDKFLGQVLGAIAEQFDSPLAEYWYHPEDTAYIGMMSWQGQIYKRDEIAALYPNHSGIVGHRVTLEQVHGETLQNRKQYFITEDWDIDAFTRYERWYPERGFYKEINVPMVLGDECIGALVVRLPHGYQITTQQIELAQALAHQATLAAQLTRLAEEAKQAAIAREQEQAALERAAELAKANAVLRRTASQLVGQQDLSHFLSSLLLEITQEVGAVNNSIFLYDQTADSYQLYYSVQDGQVVDLETDPRFEFWHTPTPADNEGWKLIQSRGYLWSVLDIDATQYDELCDWTIKWHRQMQHRAVMCFLLQVGDKPLGFMGLCFREAIEPSADRISFIQTLANQATLAIQLTRLVEEAKQAAIANEQEKAASERAAELAKANEALRRTLDQLANDRNLDSFLSHILREAMQLLNGATAQLFLYDAASETIAASLGVNERGEALPAPGLVAEVSTAVSFRAESWSGWTYLLQQRCPVYFDLERERDYFLPEYLEYHRRRGHLGSVCTALMLGDEPLGFLGLVFGDRTTFSTAELEFFQALAQQATLAIKLTRLSEEAKQAVILEERNRMAREIHDTLAQSFTGIVVHQQAAKRLLEAAEGEDVQEHINWTLELARNGLEEARRSVWALRSHTLTQSSLPDVLGRVVEQMTNSLAIVTVFNVRGTSHSLPNDVECELLQIMKESLTNILKHASAQNIYIDLIFEVRHLRLRVQDNGRGFISQTPSTTATGFGLIGMYERVERLGGQLTITSQPGRGTEVDVNIPLLT